MPCGSVQREVVVQFTVARRSIQVPQRAQVIMSGVGGGQSGKEVHAYQTPAEARSNPVAGLCLVCVRHSTAPKALPSATYSFAIVIHQRGPVWGRLSLLWYQPTLPYSIPR